MARAVEGRPATRAPHLRLAIPTRALTKSLDAAVAQMKSARFDLPGLGDLGRFLPTKLGVAPRKLQVALDRDDAAKVDLDFDVKQGAKTLFGLALAARTPITYDPAKGRMRFSVRADLFEKVRPRLDDGAADSLAGYLWDFVPGVARPFVPRDEVRRIARRAVEALAENAYDLLREQVLSGLGEITSFEVDFPDLPLAGLSLTSIGGAAGFLRLDARLDLPIDHGLPDDDAALTQAMAEIARGQMPAQSEVVEVAVATEAVMALANWGIATGKLPARYTDTGEAAEDGRFRIGAAWEGAERPLKVHLWSLDTFGMCLYAQAGAAPSVEWQKGRLKVAVAQSRVEKLNGPPLVQLAAQLTNITEGLFDFTRTVTTATDIGVGGEGWRVALDDLRLDGRIFRLRLKASTGKKRT